MNMFVIRMGAFIATVALLAPAFGADTIAEARYAAPVERYGHFALGRPHEYARLDATTSSGRRITLELPEDEVFEDLAPRRVRIAAGEADELLAIISKRNAGARLALIGLQGDRLVISAQSPAIGTPNRWLNPVGVIDLDGDGQAEIAAVITPHIGGTLKVYRRRGAELLELAALGGFSNHVYGTSQLGLSTSLATAAGPRLLVPDATRMQLRILAMMQGRLVEVGRCLLGAPVLGGLKVLSTREVQLTLASGTKRLVPGDCAKPSP
jgi:hypothetical protein